VPTFTEQSDGTFVVSFPENGTSISIPTGPGFQMDSAGDDWHEYTVSGQFSASLPFSSDITLADAQLALLQQSAPEWRDLRIQNWDPQETAATTGSFTDTFGSGIVTHIVSDDGLVIVNQTVEGHPFHPGVVVRTVVENNGVFEVISYGIGNTNFNGGPFEGTLGLATGAVNEGAGMLLFADMTAIRGQSIVNSRFREGTECFLAGTMITMWDGSLKPIEDIAPDDIVTSYDRGGDVVPGRVTRTFKSQHSTILDVFGLMVTPGHITFCAEGPYRDKHVAMIDILRSDGALMRADGTKVRANTGAIVGSEADRLIPVVVGHHGPHGLVISDRGQLRLGSRFRLENGTDLSVADILAAFGADVDADGLVRKDGADPAPLCLDFLSAVPKPEAYILARSGLTQEDILAAAGRELGDVHAGQPAVRRSEASLH